MAGVLHESERQLLAVLRARLARVQRGEGWGPSEPGPYNATERMQEAIRIRNRISEIESGRT